MIDTGGIVVHDAALIPSEILKQAQVALEIASHILFVIDGRTEITAADRDLAQLLRRLSKPVTLVVNKIDVPARESLVPEFYSMGLGEPAAVSAEHRLGLKACWTWLRRRSLQRRMRRPRRLPRASRKAKRSSSGASKSRLSGGRTSGSPPC